MNAQPISLEAADGHRITGTLYTPHQPAAVLVISHGMSEHAGRYQALAHWLGKHGVAVVACNHRGHGPGSPGEIQGHYSDNDGWDKVSTDLYQVVELARERFPGLPLTLMGHSMGSFIAQSVAQRHGEALDALVLSATNRIHHTHLRASKLLIGQIRLWRGRRHRSATITRLTFGKFNRSFRPNRTPHDWLSRDPAQVDRYMADPLCGFECTAGLWHDFLRGMLTIDPARWRKDLPVHLFAGTDDPVGEMGKGIRQHFHAIRQAGILQTTLKLYDGGRHEMVNETNAEEVWQHLLTCISGARPAAGAC